MEKNLEWYLEEQKRLGKEIDQSKSNYSKDGKKRKKKKEYFEKKNGSLDNLFDEFKKNHVKILELKCVESAPYIAKNYYGFIERLYNEYKEILNNEEKVYVKRSDEHTAGGSAEHIASESESEDDEKMLTEYVSDNAFIKKTIELTAERVNKCVNLENATWEFYLNRLDKFWKNYERNIAGMKLNCTDYYSNQNIEAEYNELYDQYQHAVVIIEQKLSVDDNSDGGMDLNKSILKLDRSIRSIKRPSEEELKLPRIQIPKFGGDFGKWPEFRDLFSVMVHSKTNISNVQKLQYLKSLLEKDAADMLRHLSITEANYEAAWALLGKRYNNKKLLILNDLNRLFSQPVIQTEHAGYLKKMIDTTKEVLMSLQSLGENVQAWDSIIIYMLTQRLPAESYRLWEEVSGEEIQSLNKLEKFIETRFRTIENIQMKNNLAKNSKPNNSSYNTSAQNSMVTKYGNRNTMQSNNVHTYHIADSKKCAFCGLGHSIYHCAEYNKLQPRQRLEEVKKRKLCILCLGNHHIKNCHTKWSCFLCKQKHHTSLHFENNATCNTCIVNGSDVLLATAVIQIQLSDGTFTLARALIDPGSTASFTTEKIAQLTKNKREKECCNVNVLGNNDQSKPKSKNSIILTIKPRFISNFNMSLKAYVLPTLTSLLPLNALPNCGGNRFNGLTLADPKFNVPNNIDILLGSDVTSHFMLEECIPGFPIAHNTRFGWILSGSVGNASAPGNQICLLGSLDMQVERFWTIEESNVKQEHKWSAEEILAENLYESNHYRDATGRYVVKLPFKTDGKKIGRTKSMAISNLYSLERKFDKDPVYKARYVEAMSQYFKNGYAIQAPHNENYYRRTEGDQTHYNCFYLPHLAVMKEHSSSTKTRIVFDASRKSSNGVSLNDTLLTGPTIQAHIVNKILNFRQHQYVFSCDVEKMYLQIKIDRDDWAYQRFVWRENAQDKITEFCFNTVVFGVSSAPFLAIRTLKQLAHDHSDKYPIGAKMIENDFYVDDVLAGGESLEEVFEKKNELINLLREGGFELKKWCANHKEILVDIPVENRENGTIINFDEEEKTVKTLGIFWNTKEDNFQYSCNIPKLVGKYTKRQILSDAAKLFDPLGWIQPIIVLAKILLQELWLKKYGWDDELPAELIVIWETYLKGFQALAKIKISRWLRLEKAGKFEIHIFSDASEKAYGAVAYIRDTQSSSVQIIMAKSRVAPLKIQTLARLELCAALVASDITKVIHSSLQTQGIKVYAWSDSMITLGWLNKESNHWKTFVANRVAQIQEVLSSSCWGYVKSAENPADLISRGTTTEALSKSQLWWNGPPWLATWTGENSEPKDFSTQEEEKKKILSCNVVLTKESNKIEPHFFYDLLFKYSSFKKLLNVLDTVLKAVETFKKNRKGNCEAVSRDALEWVVLLVQEEVFHTELEELKTNKLGKGSNLVKLDAWIDNKGLLRVGGRLSNSELSVNQKHPFVLPYKHYVTSLIIRDHHRACFHAGNRLTLASIRSQFWIIKGNCAVKLELRNCTICKRYRARTSAQLMGQLPSARVTQHRAFAHCGCDLAGPIEIKSARGRGTRVTKGYIIIFVCMATKAIHIELVSDMTSIAFIAALKRLISRRGAVSDMYSDNGTNFVGANKMLIRQNMQSDLEILEYAKQKQINWHFLPPYSPHMGGLWEAGIKSIKYHLNRTLNDKKMTIEEMTTILCQIEACLNSRPLLPLTESTEDLEVLTPGHFLIGEPTVLPPEPSLLEVNPNLLTKWQQCSRLYQSFWNKWHSDYLNQLRQRSRWHQTKSNLSIGDVVVIKHDNIAPSQWKMGRVVQTFPGNDGLVRAVTMKTANGFAKRNITKLVPLLSSERSEAEAEPVQTTAREKRYKTRELKKLNSLAIIGILMSMFLFSYVVGDSHKLYNFKSPPGIYFESIGSAEFVKSQWQTIVYYNKTNYDSNIIKLKSSLEVIESFCGKYNATKCTVGLSDLKEKYQSIINSERILSYKPRKKRWAGPAIVGGIVVGGAAITAGVTFVYNKWFSDKTEQEIAELYDDEELQRQMLFNETQLLEGTVDLLSEQNEDLQYVLEDIQQQISNTSNSRLIDITAARLWSLFLNNIASLENIQNIAMYGKTYLNQIISIGEIEQVLNVIELWSHDDEEVPFHTTLLDIWQLLEVQSMVSDSYFIFRILLPLVDSDTFTVYHKYTIPFNSESNMLWVKNEKEYLIANTNGTSFVELTEHEFLACKQNSIFTCPKGFRNKFAHKCTLSLFLNEAHGLEACEVEQKPASDFLTPTDHAWVYSVVEERNVSIICDSKIIEQIIINDSGLLKLNENCKATGKNISLISLYSHLNKEFPSFVVASATELLKYASDRSKLRDITFKDIKTQIAELKNRELTSKLHNYHHYSAPYALVIFLSIIIFCSTRLSKHKKRKRIEEERHNQFFDI